MNLECLQNRGMNFPHFFQITRDGYIPDIEWQTNQLLKTKCLKHLQKAHPNLYMMMDTPPHTKSGQYYSKSTFYNYTSTSIYICRD